MSKDTATAFDEATIPLRSALTTLVELLSPAGVLPFSESEAMKELAHEHELVPEGTKTEDPWGPQPVQNAHSQAAINTGIAVDCCNAFLLLAAATDPPFTFSIAPVARAALENFARAHYLYETGIGFRARVARSVNDRIEGLYQASRLPLDGNEKIPAARLVALREAAAELGYELIQPQWVSEERPKPTKLIKAFFEDFPDVGHVAYSFLSAVDHGLSHGFNQFIQQIDDPSDGLGIYGSGATVITAMGVNTIASLLIIASSKVSERRAAFLGRGSADATAAKSAGFSAIVAWTDAIKAPSGEQT